MVAREVTACYINALKKDISLRGLCLCGNWSESNRTAKVVLG
jgi:hypothetical protein